MVFSNTHVFSGMMNSTSLTNQNITGRDKLTVLALNAKAL